MDMPGFTEVMLILLGYFRKTSYEFLGNRSIIYAMRIIILYSSRYIHKKLRKFRKKRQNFRKYVSYMICKHRANTASNYARERTPITAQSRALT